jgi:glycosyltransferase involved in cell wall biosynthesis
MEERKMVVVVPSYNNSKWFERNLSSVVGQQYSNFRMVYTDDCSPDSTGQLVEDYLAKHKHENVTLIRNTERKGALANLHSMIHDCQDDEIVLTLDGDDWLAHPNVLSRVNKEYQDDNVWMTWGQYQDTNGGLGCSRIIPAHVIQRGNYRRFRWCSSHLRTFYSWLFKRIKKEDLLHHGKFYSMAWDLAFQLPMLEMAGGRGRFIPDVLYIYNIENPIQDYKTNIDLQQGLERIIRSKPPYQRLNENGNHVQTAG